MDIKKGNKVKIICGKDKNKEGEIIAVSYTHLTLPTSDLV